MSKLQPPLPPSFTAHPVASKREASERSDKSETVALDILRIVADATKGQTLTARQFADYAEVLWQWTTTDVWPPTKHD